MSIAEKLQQIAQNEQKVYDAGYAKGADDYGITLILNGAVSYIEKEYISGITKLRPYALACTNLQRVSFPNSLTEIGEYAFYNCESLEQFDIPYSVESAGKAFCQNCYSLKKIDLPTSLLRINELSFANCTSLEEVIFKPSIKKVGANAFMGCTALKIIDMSRYTSVSTYRPLPELDASTFLNASEDFVIIVYKGIKSKLAAMTNWSAHADRMTEVPTTGYSIITFTIDYVEYEAITGMTWDVWLLTYFNTDSWEKVENGITSQGMTVELDTSEPIEAGKEYSTN